MNFRHDDATGALLGESDLPLVPVAGTSVVVHPKESRTGMWNTSTLSFDTIPVKKIESRLEFLDRFTDPEMEGIMGAERTNNKISVFIKKLDVAGEVDRGSQRTIKAINGLESLGLINIGRAAEILA